MPHISQRKIIKPIHHKEVSDRRNSKWSKYYGSVAWKQLRNWYITEHPLCERCLAKGISVPAEEVHHRKRFSEGTTMDERYELLLDPLNLQSLCRKCHMEIHKEINHNKS